MQLQKLGEGHPQLLEGSTLGALELLRAAGLLPPEVAQQLRRDYLFLRRIEHFLQVFEDRQTHSFPTQPEALQALARRMLGSGATAGQLRRQLDEVMRGVREAYRRFLLGAQGEG